MENKFDDLFKIIREREGFERSQEIIESLEYLFDLDRYDKSIPFIDYQQNIIRWYHETLNKAYDREYLLVFGISFSVAINLFFIGLNIWRILK